jgi:hypothetical protein
MEDKILFEVDTIEDYKNVPAGTHIYVTHEKGNYYHGTMTFRATTLFVTVKKDKCKIKEKPKEAMEKIKTLFLLRGLPGSGKSTVANTLSEDKYPVLEADQYFMKGGNYNFDMKKLWLAHGDCQKRTEEELKKGTEKVFVSNTFTTESEMAKYRELAEKYKYRLVTMIVENRHESSSVHNVPAENLEKMRTRFEIKI